MASVRPASSVVVLTLLALVAFAANSLLTRMALGSAQIDAPSFAAIRLGAGAITLCAIVRLQSGGWSALRGRGFVGALSLFAYAVPFSFAYVRIAAGIGALILFGVVQLTMVGYGLVKGERPGASTWLGLLMAVVGLGLLTVPSASRPDMLGVGLMTVAGVAWGVYTLVGRGAGEPLTVNARAFLWASLPAAVLTVAFEAPQPATVRGIVLALISGAVTSGLGYALWYRVLPRLSVMQASVAQLSVPVIAAIGGALLLAEPLTLRLVASSVLVLCGTGLVLSVRARGR